MSQVLITPTNTSGANTAKLRFKPAGSGDRLAPHVIEELERRGYVLVESTVEGTFVISVVAPTDTTKVWIQSDQNGIPQGRPKVWDVATSTWVNLIPEAEPLDFKPSVAGRFFTPAGVSLQTASFPTLGTDNYRITLTPTLYTNGAWQSPPAIFPDKYGYMIVNKSDTLFTCQFYGIPTGGMSWEWDAEVRRTTPL